MSVRTFFKRVLPERLHPYPLFEAAIRGSSRGRVMSGPFAGTCWVSGNVGSYLLPRVLGIYERELHPYLDTLAKLKIESICIVGAGEGYYVAGLGKLFPGVPITAFESDERGREIVARVAEKNRIEPAVAIRGHCSAADLKAALPARGTALVVMDVEGAERELLDPASVPALSSAFILVEAHDAYSPGVSDLLRERFRPTHKITRVDPRTREIADFPLFWGRAVALLESRYPLWAMAEGRPEGIFWLIMEPNR